MGFLTKGNLPDLRGTLPREEVDLSEFGIEGSVIVRALTAAEEREAKRLGDAQDAEVNVYIAAQTMLGEDGEPLFKQTQLRGGYGRLVRHVAEVSMRLSGLIDEDEAGKHEAPRNGAATRM